MATPVHALTSACPRRGRVPLVLALAAASAIAFLPAGSSAAAPAPTVAQVQAQAAALDLQVDISVEEYQQAQVALEGLQVKVTAQSRLHGVEVGELRLPPGTSVSLVVRGDTSFTPERRTTLRRGDDLLIVTPRKDRDATERRVQVVSRSGRLATWAGRGDR